jgi:hypothetical protein
MRARDFTQITDGTTQEGRIAHALDDHAFDVDDRGFEEQMIRCAELAKCIYFYNARNEKDGTWRELFANDEAMILMDILTTDATRMEHEFLPLLADPVRAALYLMSFYRRIDRWYQGLAQYEEDENFRVSDRVKAVIEQNLRGTMHLPAYYLKQVKVELAEEGWGDLQMAAYSPIWNLDPAFEARITESGSLTNQFRMAFYSLVSAVSYLRPIAQSRLDASLKSGQHNPTLGVAFAFGKMLEKVRGNLNQFTRRHRDFYYERVLGMKPRLVKADEAFIVLRTDPATSSVVIPAETLFTAGMQGGKEDVLYRANAGLVVTDAQVRNLRTLYCSRDAQISPEHELGYISSITTTELPVRLPEQELSIRESYPLFGAKRVDQIASQETDAAIGFAIASSNLQMREGVRQIQVKIHYRLSAEKSTDTTPGTTPKLSELFRRVVLNYSNLTAAEQQQFTQAAKSAGFGKGDLLGQGSDPKYIFKSVIGTCFQIAITAPTGWYAIKNYGVSVPEDQTDDTWTLVFEMEIGEDAPAFATYNQKIHGGSYQARTPVLRFLLNPQANLYGYSLFDGLKVEEIDMATRVKGAGRMVAWNQIGQVDLSKPFQPFGPLPTTNSYLVLGCYDAARMNLTELSVDIEWGDLPNAPEGLGTYYEQYGKGYDNDQFIVSFSILRDGRWRPAADEPQSRGCLFNGANNRAVEINNSMRLDVLEWFKRIDPTLTEDKYLFDLKSRAGFFRLDLDGPDGAFGHNEYPSLMTETLSENARAGWFKKKAKPLPRTPYTPLINRITINFASAVSIGGNSFSDKGDWSEKVFLVHPFGIESVDTNHPWRFIPLIEADGNLLIGISASNPVGALTLFFHLREDSASKLSSAASKVNWSCLNGDKWVELDHNRVLSDTTEGFLSSGIVTLDLPESIDRRHNILPSDYYWIRSSADRALNNFCSLYSVHAQALAAKRVLSKLSSTKLALSLPAGSIKSPVKNIPGLSVTCQVLPSFGGLASESALAMRTRSAERLQHKQRAVTPSDVERLVLDAFPEVYKVKCFAAMSTQTGITPKPGSILVVVIPRQPEHSAEQVFDPRLDVIGLKKIHDYLQPIASPHLQIEVCNPVYERIVIRAQVRLKESARSQQGVVMNELQQTLLDYISPWSPTGPTPRFGWIFRNDEVEAFLRNLSYIDFVTQFSMLHLTEVEDGRYELEDTARTPQRATGLGDRIEYRRGVRQVTPKFPWSIAIPNQSHLIELINDNKDQHLNPEVTGLGRLIIGNTFVVMRGNDAK